MKSRNILFVALMVNFLTFTSEAQVKVLSNGNFGIGLTNPTTKLDVYGTSINFDYTYQPLCFALYCNDPRIQSNSKVVFFKKDNSGYLDIECRQVITSSDSTKKEKIEPILNSLEKIKQLNGYTFEWKDDPSNKKNAGLIAQQVEKIIPDIVISIDSTSEKLISYTGIIPYLVEAIKEQQSIIDVQNIKIKEFENRIESLEYKSDYVMKKSQKESITSTITENVANDAFLFQNEPNPFNLNTTIKYFLPEEIISASMLIFDLQGSLIKNITISEKGNNGVIINGSELKPGMYFYSLIVDGNEVDTKRMILTN